MKQNTYTKKLIDEIDNLKKLWGESKLKFFLILLLILIALWGTYSKIVLVPELKDEITQKEQEIEKLELKLTPFTTAALIAFPGAHEEALSLLAKRIGLVELDLLSLFDYQEVASWDINGSIVKNDGNGISTTGEGPIEGWAYGKNIGFTSSGITGQTFCDNVSVASYLEVAKKYPLFPFPVFVVSECMRRNGDENWKTYRQKALEIVNRTTKIPNHHPDHDKLLAIILKSD